MISGGGEIDLTQLQTMYFLGLPPNPTIFQKTMLNFCASIFQKGSQLSEVEGEEMLLLMAESEEVMY